MRIYKKHEKAGGDGQKLIPFAQRLINVFNDLLTRLNNLTDVKKIMLYNMDY